MSGKPTFRFFSKSGCGYCVQMKGLRDDGTIDTSSPWEQLTRDKELLSKVKFVLYQYGPEKDPKTGKVINYALDKQYAGRFRGVPHLELFVDEDHPVNYEGKRSYEDIKDWILKQLRSKKFAVAAAGPIAVSAPAPMMDEPTIIEAAPLPSGSKILPPMSQNDLLKRAKASPTTRGLGTQPAKPIIEQQEIIKKNPRFLPSNYDE